MLTQSRVDYYDRLLKNSLVDGSHSGEIYYDACALCGNQKFITCSGCKIVSCQGAIDEIDCPGFMMDQVVSCVIHPWTSYCRTCRGMSGQKGVLTQCPGCSDWHCRDDQAWCIGRPSSNLAGSPKSESASGVDDEKRRKAIHPPKPEPCNSCLADTDLELVPFLKCGNRFSCWSQGNKICGDCAPEGGAWCPLRHNWYCDDCAT